MTLASTVFKKSNFQKNSHLNALGSKFDLDVNLIPNAFIMEKSKNVHFSITVLAEIIIPVRRST